MGSIHSYENAAGQRLYRIIYRRPDNKQTQERGFRRKRDAELRLAEVEVTKARGEYITHSDGRVSIDELGATWLTGQVPWSGVTVS